MMKNNRLPQIASWGALVLSLWFVYSVIMNARDLIELGIKHAPATYALVLALLLVAYAWKQNGKKLYALEVIVLTILGTSAVIWLAGLSVSTTQVMY